VDDERLTHVLAVETAVLEELRVELVADELHDKAEQIRFALERASTNEEVVWKLKALVIYLRPLDYALEESKFVALWQAVRGVRRRIAHEVDMYQRRKYSPRIPKKFGSGEWEPPKG